MNLLIFLFKSGLPLEEIEKTSEQRADRYLQVKGLIQKYYVLDKSTDRAGGVFVFDSEENLATFRESELAKSTGEAYKFLEPPHTRVLEIAKVLRE
ncbi:MAG: YdhR family protein [Candidatus Thorarchaeota archaeon]